MTDYLTDALLAAQKLQTPETLAYVRELEAVYLTRKFGIRIVRSGKKVR